MPSLDHQKNSTTEQYSSTSPLSFSGSGTQQGPVEQLSFPDYSAMPGSPQAPTPLTTTDSGIDPALHTQSLLSPAPAVTRTLTEVQTDALSVITSQHKTTTLRQPVLIRGTGRKSTSLRPPVSRRSPVMHIVVTVVLALVVLSALFAVIPVGSDGQSSLLKSIIGNNNDQMNITNVRGDNAPLIAQQAATATAVTSDGFDQGAQTYAGVPTAPPSTGSGSTNSGITSSGTGGAVNSSGIGLNSFFYGQCTFWANMRYHALTGHYVEWLGNANAWAAGAANAGWVVSDTPHIPSIIVLQAGIQGAGPYGHVGVVESIPSPGTVNVSNWNWYANGGWATLSYWNFTYPASGVSFIWHP
jgi:surface antigen